MKAKLAAGVAALSIIASIHFTSAAPTQSMASAATGLPAQPAPTWTDGKGELTTDQIVDLLGVKPTPEQRTKIDAAAAVRNAAIAEANKNFRATISEALAASDSQLATNAADEAERKRMEIIKARQPMRYQGLKNRK